MKTQKHANQEEGDNTRNEVHQFSPSSSIDTELCIKRRQKVQLKILDFSYQEKHGSSAVTVKLKICKLPTTLGVRTPPFNLSCIVGVLLKEGGKS